MGAKVLVYINQTLSDVLSLDPDLLTTTYTYTSTATVPQNTTLFFVVYDSRDPASNSATKNIARIKVYENWCTKQCFSPTMPTSNFITLADGTPIPAVMNGFG